VRTLTIAAALALSAPAFASQNHVVDSKFATGTSGWTQHGATGHELGWSSGVAGGPLPLGPCDVNNSDAIDVNDVFYLINFLFAGGPTPLQEGAGGR
jgi:hypothetical protein